MRTSTYGTMFLKKCGPQVTQFMLEEGYQYFSEQNDVTFLKFNLRKYISLDDLIEGKLNGLIIISDEGLIHIFSLLYQLLKRLRDQQLYFFKIEKQHIWIQINVNLIERIVLSHPQMEFENNFQKGEYDVFIQMYDLLEFIELKPELRKQLEQCLGNINMIENIELQQYQSIVFATELNYKLEQSITIFNERLNEIQCNIIELKYIIENIPYYFYKAILQKKCLIDLNERILNNLSDIKTLCKRQDGSKYLSKFIIQEEIIIKLNNQDYLLDGSFIKDYQKYLEKHGQQNNNQKISRIFLDKINKIVNIEEQQIAQLLNQLDSSDDYTDEQIQKIIEKIEYNINLQIRIKLQELQ